jgi:hypothetical protein
MCSRRPSANSGATGSEDWARRFFDNWRAGLKWQRLGPYERFADMIDRHWDGIAAYCKPEKNLAWIRRRPTTKSASSSDAPTACATRNIFASRFSHACFRRYDPQNHPFDCSLKTTISFVYSNTCGDAQTRQGEISIEAALVLPTQLCEISPG